ncbi:Protein seele [Pseudolycoriella hygida]|uniref:Protein seele n=1 Tax=Pseudolycoriella hygida TaxID=35572 RepID=A0A9Q0N6P8_9DIPT|nr:Protein seele [Pseudolycoriella hygida]
MKRTVILCLFILISSVLLVKSDDEDSFDAEDSAEEYVFEENEYVCKAIIDVMLMEIEKVDPKKKIQVTATKSVTYTKSESYLAELMEDICEVDETFTTIRQIVFQKTVIRRMIKNHGAVEEESVMNENVNHLCLEVLGESEEAFLKEFQKEVISENIKEIICAQSAGYCQLKNDTEGSKEREEL